MKEFWLVECKHMVKMGVLNSPTAHVTDSSYLLFPLESQNNMLYTSFRLRHKKGANFDIKVEEG